ncbi:DUF6950 family protein [Sphingopyxis macrogoltabida]|uniref:DUF6950 domain-containing protein n=1 Tax=Sphingopyxis macrogoltabida TaxID=33050 RepID=A0AAC8Z294_SPHMC|nr:hypothetical protein [Sphingopyxis macrogoltabida]ALJ14274.1 hypothetical protein LH19_15495 [Sphingopyxis macrogoltabida]AMU90539.1 hypothetical protein ATM17_16065 [Sphingopyxis macrogoltabida]
MAGLLIASAPIGAPHTVAAELRRWAVEPFDLGIANCGLSVIGYVARVTGAPVPAWLFAFGRRGAARLIDDGAQFEAAASRALSEMGCPETDAPAHGDVALVELPGSGLTACIRAGTLWAARGACSAELGPGTVRKAWRVACRRP